MHFRKNSVFYFSSLLAWVGTLFLSSCSILTRTVVKDYPSKKAFVYENNIQVISSDLSKDAKNQLTTQLNNYWDDSLKVPKVQQYWIRYKIKKPPVFDTANLRKSITFMNAYLQSLGYYNASFKDSIFLDTLRDQYRAHVIMKVNPGKFVKVDSVSFDLKDTILNTLTQAANKKSFLQKNSPYSKQLINNELDRLLKIYRNNGYYKLTREDIYAFVDSTDQRFLELTLDPFEQARLLTEIAKSKQEHPTWDVTILRRENIDSSRLHQYKIANLIYYPETKITDLPDSLITDKSFHETKKQEIILRDKKGTFTYRPLKEDTYFRRGDLFSDDKFYKTANALAQLGAWQAVDIKPIIRDKDSIDLYFFMLPNKKQSFSVDLEASRNTADFGVGNLLGISTNFSNANRNVWRSAIQSVINFRAGVELNLISGNKNQQKDLFQTFTLNAGHTLVFPRIMQPFGKWPGLSKIDNRRTLWAINGGYVERKTFYVLRSFTTSWGYEWKKGNNLFLYKPINIELYGLDKLDSLDKLIQNNPFLKASFNEGNIVSQSFSWIKTTVSKRNPDISNYYSMGVEEAGGIFGFVPGLKGNIYRYLKTQAEYRRSVKMGKNELAYRALGGVGLNYGGDSIIGPTLPFFKQFSAGGPNSMRAWVLRQLGLGSSNLSEQDTTFNAFRDRFGDMQLELNLEYRFHLASIGSFKIASAIYTDIGNVWNIRKIASVSDPKSQFTLKNLGRDLAIGLGTGLRFDMSYFLIRLDFAYKVKDPLRIGNAGWMSIKDFEWTNTRPNGVQVSNFALQLGIGLPF
jgi:outer membrane protein insertion porin family